MNNEKELFKKLIEKATREDNIEILYLVVVSLITADNNITQAELNENLNNIDLLIDAMQGYKELKELREKLIHYRNNITL